MWVLRIWLPDRPGSLAAVTGALSASGVDVVGIDVVERSGAQAVDDITIALDSASITEVVTAVSGLEGVAVEDVRRERGWRMSTAEALCTAARLFDPSTEGPLQVLCETLVRHLEADWAAVTQGDGFLLAAAGDLPDPIWLRSFVTGMAHAPHAGAVADGIVYRPVLDGALTISRLQPDLLDSEIDELSGWAAVAQLLVPEPKFGEPLPG